MTGGGKKGFFRRPSPSDHNRVGYLEVRDRFLSRVGTVTAKGQVELMVEIGAYTLDSWLAEENNRTDGTPLDEEASKPLWDLNNEADLRNMRAHALQELGDFRADLAGCLWRDFTKKFARFTWVRWHVEEAYRGLVGGLGLIALGLVLVWLTPSLVRTVRHGVNETLPASTQPRSLAATQALARERAERVSADVQVRLQRGIPMAVAIEAAELAEAQRALLEASDGH